MLYILSATDITPVLKGKDPESPGKVPKGPRRSKEDSKSPQEIKRESQNGSERIPRAPVALTPEAQLHISVNMFGMGCSSTQWEPHISVSMFTMGRPMAATSTWAALWLRSPYGRVLNMFGMGHPKAAENLWARA